MRERASAIIPPPDAYQSRPGLMLDYGNGVRAGRPTAGSTISPAPSQERAGNQDKAAVNGAPCAKCPAASAIRATAATAIVENIAPTAWKKAGNLWALFAGTAAAAQRCRA